MLEDLSKGTQPRAEKSVIYIFIIIYNIVIYLTLDRVIAQSAIF